VYAYACGDAACADPDWEKIRRDCWGYVGGKARENLYYKYSSKKLFPKTFS
jgi:hypothetical protein